jgi:DNA-binding MarR family transcriptional regulator
MSGRLANEIKQTKPFDSAAEEAVLNIHRTASQVALLVAETLKPYGITETQYNILRILRGAGKDGLSCQEIGARMITREPDLTRLFDRLEKRRLLSRARSAEDRRVVLSRITDQGLQLLADLDPATRNLPKKILGHLSEAQLRTLIDLLEKARDPG